VSTDYPGAYSTIVSRDGGKTWQSWSPRKSQAEGPFVDVAAAAPARIFLERVVQLEARITTDDLEIPGEKYAAAG
jgi:hypothetical protein